jgi:hypothetical protein
VSEDERVFNIEGSDGKPISIVAEDGAHMTVNISSTFHSYAYPQWLDDEVRQIALEAIRAARGQDG